MGLKRKYKTEIIYINYNDIFSNHESNHLDSTIKALLDLKKKYVTNGKYDDIVFDRNTMYSDEMGDVEVRGCYMESNADYQKRLAKYEEQKEKRRLKKEVKAKEAKKEAIKAAIEKEKQEKLEYERLKKKFETA
jgi:hypothetical protein